MTKAAAEDAVERLNLGAANRLLAGYWLSLWQGNALPRREQFDPSLVKPLLPNLMLFDVVPENKVTVQLAGSDVKRITGQDFNGVDWVGWVPVRYRGMRMRNLTAVARGAVMTCHRRMQMTVGNDRFNEELVLPFAINDDGLCPVVAHPDWRLDPVTTVGVPVIIEHCARDHKVVTFANKKQADDLPMAAV